MRWSTSKSKALYMRVLHSVPGMVFGLERWVGDFSSGCFASFLHPCSSNARPHVTAQRRQVSWTMRGRTSLMVLEDWLSELQAQQRELRNLG